MFAAHTPIYVSRIAVVQQGIKRWRNLTLRNGDRKGRYGLTPWIFDKNCCNLHLEYSCSNIMTLTCNGDLQNLDEDYYAHGDQTEVHCPMLPLCQMLCPFQLYVFSEFDIRMWVLHEACCCSAKHNAWSTKSGTKTTFQSPTTTSHCGERTPVIPLQTRGLVHTTRHRRCIISPNSIKLQLILFASC